MIARLLICLLLALGVSAAQPANVRIGVFGLFQPQELLLRPADGGLLRFQLEGAGDYSLEGRHAAQLTRRGPNVLLNIDGHIVEGSRLLIEQPTVFELTVPGKLSRRYFGALHVVAHHEELQAVVTMDLETATAAVLSAESDLAGPRQALLAQAVASRSYLSAGARHESFDFCDSTHCQYLADGLNAQSRGLAQETAGLVLRSDGRIFQALFTRSCDGRTRTPQEVGLPGGSAYQAVECPICVRQPVTWSRTHPFDSVAELIRERSEQARLNVVRRLGWDAIPSNAYQTTIAGGTVTFHGAGEGHGIGLCQRGAVGLALPGAEWRDILNHYFPAILIR